MRPQGLRSSKCYKFNRPFLIFLPKSISWPNFTKSEGKVRFGQHFFENDPFDEPRKMPSSKKFYLFMKSVKSA